MKRPGIGIYRKIAAAALAAALCLSGCSSEPVPQPETSVPPDQSERIEELEAQLAAAEEELERAANQGRFGEYAYYTMERIEPEFSQAIVNCEEGVLTSPVELGLKCGHRMVNEYAEVVAKCRIAANAELIDPPEEWLLIQCSVMDATVKAVKRGNAGEPGELKGSFNLTEDMGVLYANTDRGVFGTMDG